MTASIAEVYLQVYRKSMVPVLGEAVPEPFRGQIELDSWTWNLVHAEDDDGRSPDKGKSDKSPLKAKSSAAAKDDGIVKRVEAIQNDGKMTQAQRNKKVLDRLRDAQDDRQRAAAKDDNDGSDETGGAKSNPLNFRFTKNVDLASTQMLNSMKAGELLPRAVLTLYHRSINAPLSLVVTFQNVTLIQYDLDVDVTDTMTDLKETWTAEFEQVDYVYKNRPDVTGSNQVTQGTTHVFKMKPKSH